MNQPPNVLNGLEKIVFNRFTSPVIVIGMHRSGTTLIAEWLNKMGIFMGAMRDHNGESIPFLSTNQKLLAANGADWKSPKSVVSVPSISAAEFYALHMASPSLNKFKLMVKGPRLWGFKDPRNTFTLSSWLSVFPNATIIHVIRDGGEVAKSLQARNKTKGEVHAEEFNDFESAFNLWEKYVEEGLKYKNHPNYHEIRYEEVLCLDSRPLRIMEKIYDNNPTTLLEELLNKPKPRLPLSDAELTVLKQSKLYQTLYA